MTKFIYWVIRFLQPIFQLDSKILPIVNNQVAASTLQIVYKLNADFFENDRQALG